MSDEKPLAELIAEGDAAVAQYRDALAASILGDEDELDFDRLVVIAAFLSSTMLDAWPRMVTELRHLQRELGETLEECRTRGKEITAREENYLAAVQGRQEFRQAYREMRDENAQLRAEVSRLTGELEVIYERRQALTVETETDNAQPAVVRLALLQCLRAWEPSARVLGNVRAGDVERAIVEAQDRCAALEAENAQLLDENAELCIENAQLRGTLMRVVNHPLLGGPRHYALLAEVRRVLGK